MRVADFFQQNLIAHIKPLNLFATKCYPLMVDTPVLFSVF